ncbi:hypothetical protein MFLAVUS_010730 [Mucor flavus]|uniref:Uncharacterized protein n=1 Tax=Mucor flavus TaxID=439312 RepID=A0ABP9ZDJ9_9FUNG
MRSSIVFFVALATLMISLVHAYGTENKRSVSSPNGFAVDQSSGRVKVKRQSGGRGGRGGRARGGSNRGPSAAGSSGSSGASSAAGGAKPAGTKSGGVGGIGGLGGLGGLGDVTSLFNVLG